MINIKQKLYEAVDPSNNDLFDKFMFVLIFLNTIALMLETVQSIHNKYGALLDGFEAFCVGVFIFEYVIRVWTCTNNEKYKSPIKGRLRYMMSPMAIIDMVSIFPVLLPFVGTNVTMIRMLRAFRILRVIKLGRYSEKLQMFDDILYERKDELILSLVIIIFSIMASSSLMYFVENDVQSDKFSSIPATMWWAAVTLTTIGYGDMYPVTPLGQFLTVIIALLGFGIVAIPTGIISAGFVEAIRKERKCPHCNKNLY